MKPSCTGVREAVVPDRRDRLLCARSGGTSSPRLGSSSPARGRHLAMPAVLRLLSSSAPMLCSWQRQAPVPEAPGRVHAGIAVSGEWFSGVSVSGGGRAPSAREGLATVHVGGTVVSTPRRMEGSRLEGAVKNVLLSRRTDRLTPKAVNRGDTGSAE